MRSARRRPLTIVFVTDMFGVETNGIVTSARRMCEQLRAQGHTVRVVGTTESGKDKVKNNLEHAIKHASQNNSETDDELYVVRELRIPVVNHFAKKQSFIFGTPKIATFQEAFEGADVVHFFMPMMLEQVGVRVAKRMGIPITAAFHVQAENITYNISPRLQGADWAATGVYKVLYEIFYNAFPFIHCPSEFIKNQLLENGYGKHAKLVVISNGVGDRFQPPALERRVFPLYKDTFDILMVGRLSPEKNQKVLIRAVQYSRYAKHIRIFFAGGGADQKMLQTLGSVLPRPPSIHYYSQKELVNLMHSCDLYVHTASVEIEAISCLEALATGLVPVIANSDKSATRQFALDDRSLFINNDPRDLARQIDYWIEHPVQRVQMSKVYAKSADVYRPPECGRKMEDMLYEAVEQYQK